MKQIHITIVFLLAGIIFNVQTIAANNTNHRVVITNSVSTNLLQISDAALFLSHTTTRETCQHSFQKLLPIFYRYSVIGHSKEIETEQQRKSQIIQYTFFAENLILRLEVTDIIYPFNYYW
jgi:hypothetical protein